MKIINKLKKQYKQVGLLLLIKKISIKSLSYIYYGSPLSYWYELDLNNQVESDSSDDRFHFEYHTDDKKEIYDFLEKESANFSWIYFEEEKKSAIENSHIYLVVKKSSKIVGFVKVGINSVYIHDFKLSVNFPERTSFIYDVFVHPECRGYKLSSKMLIGVSNYMIDKSYKNILCHIEQWNIPAIKTFESIGYKKKCSLKYMRFAFLRIYLKNNNRIFLKLFSCLR